MGLIPGSGCSPGLGNGNPLQYSYLENSMGRGAWKATVHKNCKELDMTEHACVHARTHTHFHVTNSVQLLSHVQLFATPWTASYLITVPLFQLETLF